MTNVNAESPHQNSSNSPTIHIFLGAFRGQLFSSFLKKKNGDVWGDEGD